MWVVFVKFSDEKVDIFLNRAKIFLKILASNDFYVPICRVLEPLYINAS